MMDGMMSFIALLGLVVDGEGMKIISIIILLDAANCQELIFGGEVGWMGWDGMGWNGGVPGYLSYLDLVYIVARYGDMMI